MAKVSIILEDIEVNGELTVQGRVEIEGEPADGETTPAIRDGLMLLKVLQGLVRAAGGTFSACDSRIQGMH